MSEFENYFDFMSNFVNEIYNNHIHACIIFMNNGCSQI